MKLKCAKAELMKGISTVQKAVPSKTTMSILECILIDTTMGEIKLTANDTDLGIETIIQGTIIEPGIIALEAKVIFEIIRKLPNNDVTITVDENYNTLITCEKSKFNIVGRSGEDFTYLPDVEKNNSIDISQYTLKESIRQTIFSISNNDNNKIMTGELFEIHEDTLRIASLDGHRISIRKVNLKESYENKKLIVPGKTLSEISKILTGEIDKNVTIYYTDNHILFEFENTKVVSRLIEGEYFKIDQMLSSDYQTKITINKKELLDCIDRGTLLIKEGDKKPIIFQIEEDRIELKISSFIGSMNEEISIEKEGKDLMIGFNPNFLIDALKVIDDEEINIMFINSKAPCYIKNDEESYVYLVLPVNFNHVSNDRQDA